MFLAFSLIPVMYLETQFNGQAGAEVIARVFAYTIRDAPAKQPFQQLWVSFAAGLALGVCALRWMMIAIRNALADATPNEDRLFERISALPRKERESQCSALLHAMEAEEGAAHEWQSATA